MTAGTIKPLPLADLSLPAISPKSSANVRLVSLDVFRGLTIAAMFLVNNPGDWGHVYWPLDHARWHGITPTDLVFPFFLFIVGVAIPFSQAKREATESKREQLLHILRRGLTLFVLGELGYAIPTHPPSTTPDGFILLNVLRIVAYIFLALATIALLVPWRSRTIALLVPLMTAAMFVLLLVAIHFVNRSALASGLPGDFDFGNGILRPDTLRIPGVLQRIGICYAVAATIYLFGGWRAAIASLIIMLAAYSLLMLKVSYPSLENPGVRVHGKLDETDNFARYVDETVFGKHVWHEYPDPEGIVSTLPAIGSVLLGICAGVWMRTRGSVESRDAGLFVIGVATTIAGYVLAHALMPLNKHIWTPSFAVYTAGLAMLGLGVCFWFVDILGWRKATTPLRIFGVNAILAYVLAGVFDRLMMLIRVGPQRTSLGSYLYEQLVDGMKSALGPGSFWTDPHNTSLAYAIGYVLLFFALMSLFYVLKLFVKL